MMERIKKLLTIFMTRFLLAQAQYISENELNTRRFSYAGSENDSWTDYATCPPATYITAYNLTKSVSGNLLHVGVHCSQFSFARNEFNPIAILGVGVIDKTFTDQDLFLGSFQKDAAVGFRILRYFAVDEDGDRVLLSTVHHEFLFPGESEYVHGVTVPGYVDDASVENYVCSAGFALCGIAAEVTNSDEDAEAHVRQLAFQCCYACHPQELQEVLWENTNDGLTPVTNGLTLHTGVYFAFESPSEVENTPEAEESSYEAARRSKRSAEEDKSQSRRSYPQHGNNKMRFPMRTLKSYSSFGMGLTSGYKSEEQAGPGNEEQSMVQDEDTATGEMRGERRMQPAAAITFLSNSILRTVWQGAKDIITSYYNQQPDQDYDWPAEAEQIEQEGHSESKITVICEPQTKCVYTRVIQVCGYVHVNLSKLIRSSTSLG